MNLHFHNFFFHHYITNESNIKISDMFASISTIPKVQNVNWRQFKCLQTYFQTELSRDNSICGLEVLNMQFMEEGFDFDTLLKGSC